jgi:hypothetical protein
MVMSIDIDNLSEAELHDLNHRIVERLRFMRQARAHVAMLRFRIGQRVWFQPEGRERIVGVVARYNKKSVTVVTPDGGRWTVAPGFLHAEPEVAEAGAVPANVVRLPHK